MPPEADPRAGSAIVAEAEPRSAPGVFQNSLTNVAGLGVITALGALAGWIGAQALREEGVGILAVAFGIGEFGRALSACTHIPSIVQYHAGRDEGTVFGSSLLVKALFSGLFLLAIALSIPFLEATFHVPGGVMLLAASVLLVGTSFEVGAARLEAHNRMVRSNLILASGSVVMLLVVASLWGAGRLTVYTSAAATLLSNVVMALLAWRYARPGATIRADVRLAWSMTKAGLRIVSASLLTQGLLWTDTLLVSYLLGNRFAGVYNVVFMLTFAMVMASSAMGVALVPALSKLAASGQDTARGYHRGTVIALGMSGTLAIVYVVAGHPILGLYGPAFTAGYPALVILTVFGLSAALTVPAATMLTIHGRAGLLTMLSLAQLVVNVPLNVMLILRFGLIGAAAATTTVFVLGTAATWLAVRRTTGAWPLSLAALREARDFAVARIDRLRA